MIWKKAQADERRDRRDLSTRPMTQSFQSLMAWLQEPDRGRQIGRK